jgi:hypothetical protein
MNDAQRERFLLKFVSDAASISPSPTMKPKLTHGLA